MPKNRKVALNDTAIFITTSVEEGLIFPPNPLVNLILRACLLRAQKLHNIEVCHFAMEATHLHMIARVSNPDDVKGFMERFKTESSHAINRLLGRKKRTIWCEGYDSPVLLTPEAVVKETIYTYGNPAKDGLVDSIDSYPGLSSWSNFLSGKHEIEACLLTRDQIKPLGSHSLNVYEERAKKLESGKTKSPFILSPNAWMRCFNITEPAEVAKWNQRIIDGVRDLEQHHQEERAARKEKVIGAQRLCRQRIGHPFEPDRHGKRVYCVSTDIELRKEFIAFIKGLINKAKLVLAEWRRGNLVPYPLGLYPPSFPKLAEPVFAL